MESVKLEIEKGRLPIPELYVGNSFAPTKNFVRGLGASTEASDILCAPPSRVSIKLKDQCPSVLWYFDLSC